MPILSLIVQANSIDWRAKEIPLSQLEKRSRFHVVRPTPESGLTLLKAWIVWVPGGVAVAGRSRQAVRLRFRDRAGHEADIVESPSIGLDARATIGSIIGQGCFPLPMKLKPLPTSLYFAKIGSTDIGFVTNEHTVHDLYAFAQDSDSLSDEIPA